MEWFKDCFFACRDTYAFSFNLLRARKRSLLLWIGMNAALFLLTSLLFSLFVLPALYPALFIQSQLVWLLLVAVPLVLALALVLLLGKMRLAASAFIKGDRIRFAGLFEPFHWPTAYPKCLLLVLIAMLLYIVIDVAYFFLMTEINSFVSLLHFILISCALGTLVLSAAVRLVGTKARCRVRDMLRPQKSVYVPLLFATAGLLLLCLPVNLVTLLADKLLPPLVVSWLIRLPLYGVLEAWFLTTVCFSIKEVVDPAPHPSEDVPEDAPRDTMEPPCEAQETVDSSDVARRDLF